MIKMGVGLYFMKIGDPYRLGQTDPGKIVPLQIDEHVMFSHFFHIVGKLLFYFIFVGIKGPWVGTAYRVGGDVVCSFVNDSFG